MPELPDVEVFRRYLEATALHKEIEEVQVLNSRVLEGVSARRLARELRGSVLERTERHGKYLFVRRASPGGEERRPLLALHFGMTGCLAYFKDPQHQPEHTRVALRLDNGYTLTYVNQRLLGSVRLVEDLEGFLGQKRLGPDVLRLDFEGFSERLRRGRGSLKSTLMNQKLLAGLGNLYSDEILFQARLRPRAKVGALDEKALRRLHATTRRVLRTAIEAKADPADMPRSWLLPRREEGEPCPRCGAGIRKAKVSGRSAYFCPDCQQGGPV